MHMAKDGEAAGFSRFLLPLVKLILSLTLFYFAILNPSRRLLTSDMKIKIVDQSCETRI